MFTWRSWPRDKACRYFDLPQPTRCEADRHDDDDHGPEWLEVVTGDPNDLLRFPGILRAVGLEVSATFWACDECHRAVVRAAS